ncbi:MAG: SRPBCC domain-containing protein [Paludibacter sp.]
MQSITLTVHTTINQNLLAVWDCYTKPEHIVKWNFASDDWHCPAATNDFRVGGKFSYTMADRDGSFSFDFSGTFVQIFDKKHIEILLDDNRKVWLDFSENENENETTIVEKFEAENENTPELQQTGWQMILNNLKKHAESL